MIIRILYPKLIKRRGKINKKNLQMRKSTIFNFFAALDPIEFQFLLDLIFSSFGIGYLDSNVIDQIH